MASIRKAESEEVRKPRIGMKVRKIGGRQVRVVDAVLEDIPGGVKLDGPIEGIRYWNMEELEVVKSEREAE